MFRSIKKVNPFFQIRRNLFSNTYRYPIVKGEHQLEINSKNAEFRVESALNNNKLEIRLTEKNVNNSNIQTELLNQPFNFQVWSENPIFISHYKAGEIFFININAQTSLRKRPMKVGRVVSVVGSLIGAGFLIGVVGAIGVVCWFVLDVLGNVRW